MNRLHDGLNLRPSLCNRLVDELVGCRVCHEISSSHREPGVHVELGDNRLHVVDVLAGRHGTHVVVDRVNGRGSSTLLQNACHELAILDGGTTGLQIHDRECPADQLGAS